RTLSRRLRGLALERLVHVERALDSDLVEVLVEPRLRVGAAEVAQLLEERPAHVGLGRGAELLELARAADAVQPLLPVFVALEEAPTDEAGDEVGGSQFCDQTRVEGDLVDPVVDLRRRSRRLVALDRIDLDDDRVAAMRLV